MSFLSVLISGLSLGSMYALISLGYTMVYGIAKMLNFAHGDIIMIGGIATYEVMTVVGGTHPVIAIFAAVFVCTLLGVLIEKVAYKPLRKASSLAVLITAIGVSYFLQNIALLTFGTENKSYTFTAFNNLKWVVNEHLTIQGTTIINISLTVIIMIALSLFIKFTKPGKAMKAVSEDKDAAQLMGVNVNGTISLTFAIGSALAGLAGFLFLGTYGQIGAYSGTMPGIKAFTAAVFGGIGSIPGAMIGALILGIIEQVSKSILAEFQLSALADAIVFIVLILVLLIKPTGILGKKIHEKV
ncbi:MAG: branched-chain amino acid ABC transporter permease [Oscillospiraceae bacterium]